MTALRRLAEGHPPRISAIIRMLCDDENGGERAWFEDLLDRTLPRQAWEILQMADEWEQVLSFAARFSTEYFPLHEGYLEMQAEWDREQPDDEHPGPNPHGLLKEGIPFQLMGFTWEEQHEIWSHVRYGLAALALLIKCPVHNEFYTGEVRGMREAWLESAADLIPAETLQRIPEEGIPLELLEEAVGKTHLKAVPLAARWVYGMTGTYFLDESFPEDFTGEYPDPWDDETIELASREWDGAKAILDQIDPLTAWLEEDLPERFAQMLDLILKELEEITGRRDDRENRV